MNYKISGKPKLHFTPEKNWMNDPNGLVFYKGEYHLFYQYYPEDIVWGPMHWGHAVSKDLISWEHLDIALYPDDLGMIFSGSAAADEGNRSGLFSTNDGGIILYYTSHLEKENGEVIECQSMAYSEDFGRSWKKYEKNPVVPNPGIRHFRDPKVFFYEKTNTWIMVIAAGDRAKLYSSGDMTNWEYCSEFYGDEVSKSGVWECPDLIELKIDGGLEKIWVFKVDLYKHTVDTNSQTRYYTGKFDGKKFYMEKGYWIDHGNDFYAAQGYSNISDGRNIWIAWMSNWDYAGVVPAGSWRSQLTIPRELSLSKDDLGYSLVQRPVREIEKYRKIKFSEEKLKIGKEEGFSADFEGTGEIEMDFGYDAGFDIVIGNEAGEEVKLSYDSGKLSFVRDKSGMVDFSDKFCKNSLVEFKEEKNGSAGMRILIDRYSVEVFAKGSGEVMTNLVFPKTGYDRIHFTAKEEMELGIRIFTY